MKIFFMLDDGVFKSNTVRANKIGIDYKVVFGFWIANGHFWVPDFFGSARFVIEAGNYSGNNNYKNDNDADDSNCFFHFAPLLFS